MLQAHTDMVCAREPWSDHNFTRDPIDIREEDGWMRANGTTLGADDGAGVANILGLLDEPDLSHPPLECVFTVQEEDGMGGAKGLDTSALASRRMKLRAIRFASFLVAGRRPSEYFSVRNRSPPLQLALSCLARISTASSSLRLRCLGEDVPRFPPLAGCPRVSIITSRTSTARPDVIR